ncbi:hypothetical protein O181_004637 [Austropuccinia psidii MF-1]|uniref:Uncharacterized protein n=1 Tax=Austropuccinia psidii MF-1 TaxID=1389203 RepID=A0A9Q3GFZ4_9BASI|nr:hypothetical protein [Austropuccinia psidii MF-1]
MNEGKVFSELRGSLSEPELVALGEYQRLWVENGVHGLLFPIWAQMGPLVVCDPPGLSPLDLGHKGPKGSHGPQVIDGIGGLNGPKGHIRHRPSNQRGWAKGSQDG